MNDVRFIMAMDWCLIGLYCRLYKSFEPIGSLLNLLIIF